MVLEHIYRAGGLHWGTCTRTNYIQTRHTPEISKTIPIPYSCLPWHFLRSLFLSYASVSLSCSLCLCGWNLVWKGNGGIFIFCNNICSIWKAPYVKFLLHFILSPDAFNHTSMVSSIAICYSMLAHIVIPWSMPIMFPISLKLSHAWCWNLKVCCCCSCE